METHQIGQTCLRLNFYEQPVPNLQQPPPNRMDVRFLLNGSPPPNTGLTRRLLFSSVPGASTEPISPFEAQRQVVGGTTRRTDKELGNTYRQAACNSPGPELSKSSRASFFLSPIVSDSPGTESPITTTPTTVMEVHSKETKRANSRLYYGKGEKMQKSIKQLHSVSSGSGTRNGFSKRKTFPCDQCGFLFGMRSNLKRHVMTVHEDRRTFTCPICNSAFGLKQNLATHIRVKHEKQRPFECDICKQSFGYKQVLQNHRRNIHRV